MENSIKSPVRVLVCGANGRLGRHAVQAIAHDTELRLAGTCEKGQDLASVIADTRPDAVLELTTAEDVYANACTIVQAGIRPIIGASGLTGAQINWLQERCATQSLGGILAPNFSIGAIIMIKLAEMAAPFFPHAEIVETHHEKKRDAPSGTALHTAERIAAARHTEPHHTASVSKNANLALARGLQVEGVPIHSVRMPGCMARQEICFGHTGQTLRIQHECLSYEAFIPGILFACQRVMRLDHLVVGLEELVWEVPTSLIPNPE